MTSLFQILILLIDVAFFIVIVYIIIGWLIAFQVLNLGQPIVAQLWLGLNRLLEPVFGPIRRLLPPLGGLDLAPLIVILALYIIEIILRNNAAIFFLNCHYSSLPPASIPDARWRASTPWRARFESRSFTPSIGATRRSSACSR